MYISNTTVADDFHCSTWLGTAISSGRAMDSGARVIFSSLRDSLWRRIQTCPSDPNVFDPSTGISTANAFYNV